MENQEKQPTECQATEDKATTTNNQRCYQLSYFTLKECYFKKAMCDSEFGHEYPWNGRGTGLGFGLHPWPKARSSSSTIALALGLTLGAKGLGG